MSLRVIGRTLPIASAAVFLLASAVSASPSIRKIEKHYSVTGRPVVVIHNIGNGRIEVKPPKNSEVAIFATQPSDKFSLDIEQVGDRIDVNPPADDLAALPADTEVNFQLVVPEETELQLKTQTGLIYVE